MFDHPAYKLSDRACATLLAAIVLLAVVLRIAAAFVLKQPLDSDPLAYFTMAQGLAERAELLDMYGQHAFYSAGYPLLLGIALCAIGIARDKRPIGAALLAGVLWGAALVTGGSSLLLCAGVAVALLMLWRARGNFTPAFAGGLCFIASAALILAPWLYATNQMVGRPVLTTNAAFNLYLGNNPAATGKFVSIADTPLGKNWEDTRIRLGEVRNADRLQNEALRWIGDNPGRAAELAALKLVYFWQPNIPDATDFRASKAIASIRLFEVAQYALILLFGFAAFRSRLIASDGKWIFAAMIAGFWLIHAAAYIITRYRDPAIPLLIVMGAIPVAAWLEQFAARRLERHAA